MYHADEGWEFLETGIPPVDIVLSLGEVLDTADDTDRLVFVSFCIKVDVACRCWAKVGEFRDKHTLEDACTLCLLVLVPG